MTPLGTAANHPNYSAAKQGANLDAAFDLVNDILPDEKVHELQKKLGDKKPIIVPVHAEEAQGKNKIPIAFAAILAVRIGIFYNTDIVQINKPYRTGKGAYYRLVNYPIFDGPVEIDQDYLILDDTLTMGGTFASLRGHIENKGGRVIMATALTGHPGAANISITSKMLRKLQEKHGNELDIWWKEQFGFGIDSLTQGEAGHLAKAPSLDAIRDRIVEAGFEGQHGVSHQ
jgi:hypoxanthine-guanine phosphoribosyltransferase